MKKQKWIVEFQVSEEWVADGFELTQEKAEMMLALALPFATSSEFEAKIVKAPLEKVIKKIQGYK